MASEVIKRSALTGRLSTCEYLTNKHGMADVAQLVRALDCGSGGRGFETHHSPQVKNPGIVLGFLLGNDRAIEPSP